MNATANFTALLDGKSVQIGTAIYRLFRKGDTVPIMDTGEGTTGKVTKPYWLGQQMSQDDRVIYFGAELSLEHFLNQSEQEK
jgi:hypothetical protein